MTEICIGNEWAPPSKRKCCNGGIFSLPSALTVSASYATTRPKEYIHPKKRELPLFSHWFALQVYDVYLQNCLSTAATTDDIKLYICNKEYKLSHEILTECAENFKSTAAFCFKERVKDSSFSFLSEGARCQENTYSSLLTPILNKLIGNENAKKFCSQLVIRIRDNDGRKCDKPDHVVITFQHAMPSRCLLVSDSKKESIEDGKNEVLGYGLALKSRDVFLGLVITSKQIHLQLLIPFNMKLSVISLFEASIASVVELKSFFCGLYAALCSLHDDPVKADNLGHAVTLWCCDKQLSCLDEDEYHINLGQDSSSNPTAIIHCLNRGIVKKYYDNSFHHIPRHDAIALLPNSKFLCPHDSTYQVLEYKYLEGTHTFSSREDVVAGIVALNQFHAQDLVHGDVRASNIIVANDSHTVHFIDVDLANKEGERYPISYNHSMIDERHEDATANAIMKKIHDRYSLHSILLNNGFRCDKLLDISVSLSTDLFIEETFKPESADFLSLSQ